MEFVLGRKGGVGGEWVLFSLALGGEYHGCRMSFFSFSSGFVGTSVCCVLCVVGLVAVKPQVGYLGSAGY